MKLAGSRTIWLALLVFFLVAAIPAQFGGSASAGTVDLLSGPQSGSNSINGSNTGIVVSPAWAASGPGFEWISYGNTGCNEFIALTGLCTPGPENPAGTNVTSTPTATFYQTFTITDALDHGTLFVWADDTAGVWLDTGTVSSGDGSTGLQEWAANSTPGTNCAGGAIGCITGMDAAIPLNLTTGTYTLVIDAYQLVGGSPFGVMYNGTLSNSSDTPEPASFLLMGLGLAGLGSLIRRRKRA